MAFIAYSAKNAKIRYASTVITGKLWTVDAHADPLETTHFESGGWHENIAGIRKLTFTIECNDNAAQSFFDISWKAGTILSSHITLYVNDVGSPYWQLTYPFLETIAQRADVKDGMMITFNGNAIGQFLYPTGTHSGTT